jgi:endonuclease YncB( thermonuclease family)
VIAPLGRAGEFNLLRALAMPVVLALVTALSGCTGTTAGQEPTSPTPAVSDSSSARLAEIDQAEQIRAALAEELAANTRAEVTAASERLANIEQVLATGGTVPPPTADTGTSSTEATIDRVVDGDTVVTSTGVTVRIIGIDAPESGACGSEQAAVLLRDLVEGKAVTLVNPISVDDTDKYGRILRYVDTDANVDVAIRLLDAGLAVARYDYLDGYDWHPREDAYRALDLSTPHACGVAAENDPTQILEIAEPQPVPAPAGLAGVPAAPAEPWNLPGPPDLDCKDIGHRVTITGTDYHHLDADGDGIGCESWG